MIYYSDRLIWAMNKEKVSVRELADELETSYQAVKKVIDGKSISFNSANNAKAAQFLNINSDWLALGLGSIERHADKTILAPLGSLSPKDYVRLEHLYHRPVLSSPSIPDDKFFVHHLDVHKSFLEEKFGNGNTTRIKLLTAVGQSMMPAINDQDLVLIDTEHTWIDAPGYYVIDTGGLLILKKALIQANQTLILKSENSAEFPDEEQYDLETVAASITIRGKALAWWTLKRG